MGSTAAANGFPSLWNALKAASDDG